MWKPELLLLDDPLANLDCSRSRWSSRSPAPDGFAAVSDGSLDQFTACYEVEEVSDKLLLLSKGGVRYFGPVSGIGATRSANVYELTGDIELEDLRRALSGRDYHSLYYNGVAYVLTTSTSVAPQDVYAA